MESGGSINVHGGAVLTAKGASASTDGTIGVWEVSTGKEKRTFTYENEQMTSVVFFKDGKKLAAASRNATIRILDVDRDVHPKSHGPDVAKKLAALVRPSQL